MTQHRHKWTSIAAGGFALALAIASAAALAQPAEDGAYRDGYRRGFDDGYAQGYRKGLDEGRPPVIVAPPPPPPPPRHTISITRAVYGAGPRRCDASRTVGMIANGQVSVSIEASNDLCGDPAKEQKKRLEVSYVCGRVAKTAFARERDSVYLDCR